MRLSLFSKPLKTGNFALPMSFNGVCERRSENEEVRNGKTAAHTMDDK